MDMAACLRQARPRLLGVLLLAGVPWSGGSAAAQCRGPEDLGRPAAVASLVPNQFGRANGGGLGCALPPDTSAEHAAAQRVPYLACLRIGPVGVGDAITAAERILGSPDRVVPLAGGVESRVYFIRQRSDAKPYYVLTVHDGKVVALQLHGPPTEMPLTFSSLALGDPPQKVLDTLGAPARHCPDQVRSLDTWYYPPYPFSLDLADGALIGIRMSVPVSVSEGME